MDNDIKPVLRKQANWEDLYLCHMVDKMMTTYQQQLEKTFVQEGGIKERMTAARLGYRTNQREEIARLTRELEAANRRIAELEAKLAARASPSSQSRPSIRARPSI